MGTLKPGTILEWGNHWARGINYRNKNECAAAGFFSQGGPLYNVNHLWRRGINYRNKNECAAAGFFSQVGPLYNVNHLWAYKDMKTRREMRESAWQRPGWNDTVTSTVQLIRHMDSKIMVPTSFSPMK